MQLADLERARAEKASMTPEQLADMKRRNVRACWLLCAVASQTAAASAHFPSPLS